MRRITLWLFSTVAALVLLFSYRTSTDNAAGTAVAASTPVAGNVPSPTTSSSPAEGSSPSPTASSPATTGPGSVSKTYAGAIASTRWGDVQVAITVIDGKITDVQVPVYPTENHRDQEINAYALPILTRETLQAQNADIDTVSGATVTTDGYLRSLQSALDAAHLP